MTTTYLGELSIRAALPGASAAALAGATGIAAALPDILARISALQACVPTPVNFAQQLALAEQIVASVTAGIQIGIPVPSIDAQIAAVLALVSSLIAQVTAVHAQLAIVTDFQALLGAAGLHALAYAGPVSSFGGELDSALAIVGTLSPSDTAFALVLLTTSGATWDALTQITVRP